MRQMVWAGVGLLLVMIFTRLQQAPADELIVIETPGDGEEFPQPPIVEIKRGHVPVYPRVITGQVTDVAGSSVVGALLEWGPTYPQDAPRETTRTGKDGIYRLETHKVGGHFKLGVSANEYCPQWRERLIPGPASAATVLDWKLSPETTIEVEIVGESGLPIPHLEVTPKTPQSGFYSSFSSVQQPEPIPGHQQPVPCDGQGKC